MPTQRIGPHIPKCWISAISTQSRCGRLVCLRVRFCRGREAYSGKEEPSGDGGHVLTREVFPLLTESKDGWIYVQVKGGESPMAPHLWKTPVGSAVRVVRLAALYMVSESAKYLQLQELQAEPKATRKQI